MSSCRDDLLRAIRKLKTLGNGFTIHPIGKTFLIQSVPGELTMDHTTVLQHAQVIGYFIQFGSCNKIAHFPLSASKDINIFPTLLV